jgi:hypothetical protein
VQDDRILNGNVTYKRPRAMITELAMLKNFKGAVRPFSAGGCTEGKIQYQASTHETVDAHLHSVNHSRLESSHQGYKGNNVNETPFQWPLATIEQTLGTSSIMRIIARLVISLPGPTIQRKGRQKPAVGVSKGCSGSG